MGALYWTVQLLWDAGTIESMSANTRKPSKLWTIVQKDENAKALARIALRLFGVSVNSASTERHFSKAGIIHNKLRNRLGHKKVTKMVQVGIKSGHTHVHCTLPLCSTVNYYDTGS